MRNKKSIKRLLSLICVVSVFLIVGVVAFCEGETPTLEIDFDMSTMFSWAQTIVSAMLPVVYITMGVGLGFLIIRAFRSAFS